MGPFILVERCREDMRGKETASTKAEIERTLGLVHKKGLEWKVCRDDGR